MGIEKIKSFISNNSLFNISFLERSVGCPPKTIAHWISGTKQLPTKWERPICDYLKSVFDGFGFAAITTEFVVPEMPIREVEGKSIIPLCVKNPIEQAPEPQIQIFPEKDEKNDSDPDDKQLTPHQWIEWRNECVSLDEHNEWKKALDRSTHISAKIKKEILATGIA